MRPNWQTLKALREEKAELVKSMRSLAEKSEVEKRDLSDTESKEWNDLRAKADSCNARIEREEQLSGYTNQGDPGEVIRPGLGDGAVAADSRSVAFGLEKRFADVVRDDRYSDIREPLSIGKFVVGSAFGNWRGAAAEQRAASIGSAATGGVLVPTPLSNYIIDLARNKARVMQAGAMTVPMPSNTLKIARVTGDLSPGWKAENSGFAVSDMAFDSVTLSAKTIGCVAKISLEVAQDAVNLDQQINESLSQAIALALDSVALRGVGDAVTPLGISGQSNIQTMPAVGVMSQNYSLIAQAVQKIWQQNGEPNAAIFSPAMAGFLDQAHDTLGQPLRKPDSVAALKLLQTNQVPSNLGAGSNETELYVADFTQLLIGIRQDLMLEMSREAGDSTGSAFVNGQIWIRAYLRADIQLAHPKHFVFGSGIKFS